MILGRHCATPRADMACRRRATTALAGWMRARAVRASSVTVAEGVAELDKLLVTFNYLLV